MIFYVCKLCKPCNRVFNILGLSIHLQIHGIKLIEYFIKYEGFKIPKCAYCSSNSMYNKGLKFRKTCCKIECIKKESSSRKHSEETICILRKKRFEYMEKRLGKTAFEKRNNHKLSIIEQWFYDNVIQKYELFKKYDIVNEYSEFPYFIDFAFVNIKLAVELDGPSHFRYGKQRIEHDLKKDQILIRKKWKMFRISYDELNDNRIKEFLFLLENLDKYKYEPKKLENHMYRRRRNETRILINQQKMLEKQKIKQDEFEERLKQIRLADKSYFGWVGKLSTKLKTSNSHLRKIMRKYCPEELEKAFRKKRS